MSDLAAFIIPALVVFAAGVFVLVLLAPAISLWRGSRKRDKRRGGYLL